MATLWSSAPLTATITKKYFKVAAALMTIAWALACLSPLETLRKGTTPEHSLPEDLKTTGGGIRVLGAVATLVHMDVDPSDENFKGRPPVILRWIGRMQNENSELRFDLYDGIFQNHTVLPTEEEENLHLHLYTFGSIEVTFMQRIHTLSM